MPTDREAAIRILQDIRTAFGFEPIDEPETSSLLPFLESGRLIFNPQKDELEFTLSSPLELKNKERLEVVKFKEAPASDLEYIRSGITISGKGGIILGELVTMTLKVLIRTGNIPTGIADRIKARDVDALTDIMTELGFFYR